MIPVYSFSHHLNYCHPAKAGVQGRKLRHLSWTPAFAGVTMKVASREIVLRMPQHLPTRVKMVEVGPRDGLQNEARPVPAATKIALIERLADAGLPVVEAGAFVSPEVGAADGRQRRGAGRHRAQARRQLSGAGAEHARFRGARCAARREEIAVFGAASETFSRKNINCTIDESLERFAPVVRAAKRDGVRGARLRLLRARLSL